MDMQIDQLTAGEAVVLVPHGRLDSNTSATLEKPLMAAIEGGAKKLVIDFDNLAYLSSAGLRVLLMGLKKSKAAGAKLALAGLKPNLQEVFAVSGFANLFTIAADRKAALAAIGA
ncbi:MAG TPA: STAS domain-containing protein [Azospirillaceae bacterium]|nr:STAS domain-containing protein [Azospirillaceae bacterium]